MRGAKIQLHLLPSLPSLRLVQELRWVVGLSAHGERTFVLQGHSHAHHSTRALICDGPHSISTTIRGAQNLGRHNIAV